MNEPATESLKPVHEFFTATQPLPLGYLVLASEQEQATAKSQLVQALTLKGENEIFLLPKEARTKIPPPSGVSSTR
jgi:hypothetical protein